MPINPRKKSHASPRFNNVRREIRREDIASEDTTATLDTVELLYPSLPSEDKSETEMNMMNPQDGEQQLMQRWSKQQSNCDEVIAKMQRGMQQARIQEEKQLYVDTWENTATQESQYPITRVIGMLQEPKIPDAQDKSKEYLDEAYLDRRVLAFVEKGANPGLI